MVWQCIKNIYAKNFANIMKGLLNFAKGMVWYPKELDGDRGGTAAVTLLVEVFFGFWLAMYGTMASHFHPYTWNYAVPLGLFDIDTVLYFYLLVGIFIALYPIQDFRCVYHYCKKKEPKTAD